MVCGKRGERPRTQRSPAIASMMTTGSVRGKCSALHEGQSRRQPPCTSFVAAPQWDRTDGAHASRGPLWLQRAAADARQRRHLVPRSNEDRSALRSLRALSASFASASRPIPKRAASPNNPRNTISRARPAALASVGINNGSNPAPCCFSTTDLPVTIKPGEIALSQLSERAFVDAQVSRAIEKIAGISLTELGEVGLF